MKKKKKKKKRCEEEEEEEEKKDVEEEEEEKKRREEKGCNVMNSSTFHNPHGTNAIWANTRQQPLLLQHQ